MNDESLAIRHEPRFSVRKLDATVVTVAIRQAGNNPKLQTIKGVAADVSATGMRLGLEEIPPKDAAVSIHFQIPEIGIDLMMEGVVRWIQPKDADSWWVGCSLDSPISHGSLEKMASNAIMDRRQDERLPASCKAKAKWELSSDVTNVEVINYSMGGCAIKTDTPAEPSSDRMMLIFDSESSETHVPVRVIWSRGGTKFGCAFLSNGGYLQVRQFVESKSQTLIRVGRDPLKNRLRKRETQWRWIAIAALVLLALQTVNTIGDPVPMIKKLRDGLHAIVDRTFPATNENTRSSETVTVKEESTASEPDA
ncbi:PilZ domain-containing protein [Planctomycetota bacterium]